MQNRRPNSEEKIKNQWDEFLLFRSKMSLILLWFEDVQYLFLCYFMNLYNLENLGFKPLSNIIHLTQNFPNKDMSTHHQSSLTPRFSKINLKIKAK